MRRDYEIELSRAWQVINLNDFGFQVSYSMRGPKNFPCINNYLSEVFYVMLGKKFIYKLVYQIM